jgi:hypothetical protein
MWLVIRYADLANGWHSIPMCSLTQLFQVPRLQYSETNSLWTLLPNITIVDHNALVDWDGSPGRCSNIGLS